MRNDIKNTSRNFEIEENNFNADLNKQPSYNDKNTDYKALYE